MIGKNNDAKENEIGRTLPLFRPLTSGEVGLASCQVVFLSSTAQHGQRLRGSFEVRVGVWRMQYRTEERSGFLIMRPSFDVDGWTDQRSRRTKGLFCPFRVVLCSGFYLTTPLACFSPLPPHFPAARVVWSCVGRMAGKGWRDELLDSANQPVSTTIFVST